MVKYEGIAADALGGNISKGLKQIVDKLLSCFLPLNLRKLNLIKNDLRKLDYSVPLNNIFCSIFQKECGPSEEKKVSYIQKL